MPSRRVFFLSSALFLQRRPDVKRIEANLETLCRGYPLKYPKANRGTIPEINRDPTTAVRIIIPNGNAPFSNWRPTRFAHRTERCPVPYLVFRVNAAALYTDRWNSLSLSLSVLQPHVSTVRLPSIHSRFHSIAMLFYSGTESSERARAFTTDEKSGPDRRDERKKRRGRRKEEERYIYIYTRRALFNFD